MQQGTAYRQLHLMCDVLHQRSLKKSCPEKKSRPEDAQSISAMTTCLLPEAGGVAHILQGQIPLIEPLVAVHGAQRLLTGGNQVLVITLTCICRYCFLHLIHYTNQQWVAGHH